MWKFLIIFIKPNRIQFEIPTKFTERHDDDEEEEDGDDDKVFKIVKKN